MENYHFKNNWHQCFFQIGKWHHASTTALTNFSCSKINIVRNTCPESWVIHYISQDQADSSFYPSVTPSSLPFLCQEISSTTSPSWESSEVTSCSFLEGHIKQWAQSSPPYSRNAHLCYNSWFTRMCAANTREHKIHLEHTLTQAWLCWRRGWQHKSKNIFSFSLKKDFLSWLALFIQCRRVSGFKNRMTHTCLDVYKLCAVTEDVWRKCQEGLSTALWG